MSNKDYRELQITSSQLVIIFLAIIILGVVIFLLGISVGKKQSQIALASQTEEQATSEVITQEQAVPVTAPENKSTPAQPAQKTEPPPQKTTAEKESRSLEWFIQVGAFQNRDSAQSLVEKFRADGYNVVILSPSASENSRLFRVRIGGYASKDLADRAKAEMVRRDPRASEYLVIRQR